MKQHKKYGYLIGVSVPVEEIEEDPSVFDEAFDRAAKMEGVDGHSDLVNLRARGRLYVFAEDLKHPASNLAPNSPDIRNAINAEL